MDDIVISVDAMGGDAAPEIVLDGLEQLAAGQTGVRYLLHGPKARLDAMLETRPAARALAAVRDAESTIAMDAKPSQAMRQGRGTSLWNAIAAVEAGEAHAVVSAGNTGALMAIAMLRLRLVPGVQRPALAASWPTRGGFAVVLDVGANVEADARQLVEFAIMGEAFHRAIYGAPRPRVALLNVGAEEQKGHEEIRAAARLLREPHANLEFTGFVEGDDIPRGAADVIVTDGFTGNIALKTAEGTARMIGALLRDALTSSLLAKVGALLARPALNGMKARMDPNTFNGALFLGVDGLVVKSHGGASAAGFAAALAVAVRMARSRFRDEVAANLARVSAAKLEAQQAMASGAREAS